MKCVQIYLKYTLKVYLLIDCWECWFIWVCNRYGYLEIYPGSAYIRGPHSDTTKCIICEYRCVHCSHGLLRLSVSGVCACSYGLLEVRVRWKSASRLQQLAVYVNGGAYAEMESVRVPVGWWLLTSILKVYIHGTYLQGIRSKTLQWFPET